MHNHGSLTANLTDSSVCLYVCMGGGELVTGMRADGNGGGGFFVQIGIWGHATR